MPTEMPTEPPRTSSANVPHPEPENILPSPTDQDQHGTAAHTALANARDAHTTSELGTTTCESLLPCHILDPSVSVLSLLTF